MEHKNDAFIPLANHINFKDNKTLDLEQNNQNVTNLNREEQQLLAMSGILQQAQRKKSSSMKFDPKFRNQEEQNNSTSLCSAPNN